MSSASLATGGSSGLASSSSFLYLLINGHHHLCCQDVLQAALLFQVPALCHLRLLQPRQDLQEVLPEAARQAEEDQLEHQGQGEDQQPAHGA